MTVYLNETVLCEIDLTNPILVDLPRWDLSGLSLNTGQYRSILEYESYILNVVGSTDGFINDCDEICFDKNNLEMKSFRLQIPEVNISSGPFLEVWKNSPQKKGGLRLKIEEMFSLRPTHVRVAIPDGDFVACFYKEPSDVESNKLRLRVAEDFDFLFENDILFGWWLSNPRQYIVDSWDQSVPYGSTGKFDPVLFDYFQLVTLDNVEKMYEKDPEIFQLLRELSQRSSVNIQDRVHKIIGDKIDRLLQIFWG